MSPTTRTNSGFIFIYNLFDYIIFAYINLFMMFILFDNLINIILFIYLSFQSYTSLMMDLLPLRISPLAQRNKDVA